MSDAGRARHVLFLLLCLPLAVLRLGIPSCVRFLAVLSGCFVSRRVCVDPLGLAVTVSKEPGLLEAGPKRCYRRGLVVPTGPLFWICVLVSTVLRQHLDLNFLPSSNLLPATGSSSVTWLNPLPFRNPSPASSRLESTRKLPASLTGALPSECHHGLSFSFDFGLLGSSDSRRRALRVGMACVGGGWRRSADFGFATPSRRFLPALPLGFLPEERWSFYVGGGSLGCPRQWLSVSYWRSSLGVGCGFSGVSGSANAPALGIRRDQLLFRSRTALRHPFPSRFAHEGEVLVSRRCQQRRGVGRRGPGRGGCSQGASSSQRSLRSRHPPGGKKDALQCVGQIGPPLPPKSPP